MIDHYRTNRDRAEQRADLRAGVIASAVLNSVGGKKHGGQFAPKDFFRFDPVGKPEPSGGQQKMPQKMIEQLWVNWSRSAGAQVPLEILNR